MPSIQYGKSTIEYQLEYSPRKDISIAVEWNAGVRVIAPPSISQEQLDSLLLKKAPWILKKQYEFQEIQEPSCPLGFLSGEKIPYLGRRYRLKVNRNSTVKIPKLSFSNGKFEAEVPVTFLQEQITTELRRVLTEWYKFRGHEKLHERIQLYGKQLDLIPTKLVIKDQEMRWGSCTSNGTILINWRILMAPMRVVDYVVVHEMAHLRYPDHSDDYWRLVRSILPDYEERKEWLRINGPTLTL